MRNRRYFAAHNPIDFANTWSVYAFNSKEARDKFLEESEGYDEKAFSITLKEVTKYATNYCLSSNKEIKPTPFSSECWMIGPAYGVDPATEGLLGQVQVMDANHHDYDRLFYS